MKKFFLFILILLFLGTTYGQDLTIKKGTQNVPAIKVDDKIWHAKIDGEDFLLLPRATVDSLTKKILKQKVIIEHHESVMAANDSLIKKYENFEQRADMHIQDQKLLIKTADSLYVGYKGLYKDLKRVVGLSTFAIIGGTGLVNLPGRSWQPVASIGLGYHRWQAQYQLGSDYHEIIVGFRWNLGF
jgi:hypothetical protein